MRPQLRTWARVLLLCCAAWALTAPAARAKPAPPSPGELASRVEEYMAARVARDHFSGTVLIARDGKILFSRGYGMANLELDVSNTPQTKFRLGSITKQFTAMAVLILQEQGKLNVHDKVKKYLPDAPAAWDEITIHHLLTHTSGIPNYSALPDFYKTLPDRVTLKRLIGRFKDRPLDFPPGAKFRYSNSGYVVLGQVIETASGQSYATFLRQAVLDPLGMKDTGYDNAAVILKHRASGYTRRLGLVLTNCDYVDMSIPHAAGALYSTTLDLLRWDQALYTEKLAPRRALESMFTPFKDNYGYGWVIDRAFGLKRYAHGGGIMGFTTVIERFPDEKLLVVVLSNLENAPASRIGNDLAAVALGKRYVAPREPAAVKLDSNQLDACAGRYEADVPGKGKKTVEIVRDGARLFYRTSGNIKLTLIPESASMFYIKTADSELRFVRDDAGKVSHLIMIEDGEDLRARRLPDEPRK